VKTGHALIEDIDTCSPQRGQCAFWWLGQQGYVIKLGTTVCYVDAYLSPRPSRLVPPLLNPEEVTNADIILGSHDHVDHIDRAAWVGLAKASPEAIFVVPELLRERMAAEVGLSPKRVLGVDVHVRHSWQKVRFGGVPAAHELLDTDQATGLHPYVGFVLEGNGVRVYHAGDTCTYEGMQALLRRHRIDVAFLPINGRDAKRLASGCIGNMTYQEAVDLAGALRPGLTVPGHFEMSARNSEDPQLFVDYMRVKYPGLATMVPQHGERVVVGTEAASLVR